MNLNEKYMEIDREFSSLVGLVEEALDLSSTCSAKDKSAVENALNQVSHVLAEMAVTIFSFRRLSWEVQREFVAIGSPAALQNSVNLIRQELKDNIYALVQSSLAMQERSRALRGFLVY